MLQDLRYGLRMLVKKKSFTVIAVLSLALGTGANTAIFSFINTLLLRPLPVRNSQRLVALNNMSEKHMFPSFSYLNYKDFRDRNESFSGLVGYRFTPLSISHEGVNERVWGYEVTGNYFDLLGVGASLGRVISTDDDLLPGSHPVAVMSYKCWQERFGSDQSIIDKDIIVNGRNYTVVGVAPEGFYGTEAVSAPDLFFPVAMQQQL